jgi:hypothetical protein
LGTKSLVVGGLDICQAGNSFVVGYLVDVLGNCQGVNTYVDGCLNICQVGNSFVVDCRLNLLVRKQYLVGQIEIEAYETVTCDFAASTPTRPRHVAAKSIRRTGCYCGT